MIGKALKNTISAVALGALAFGAVLTGAPAQAEQIGREPWRFKVLNNPAMLNQAIAIEQKEENGFGTRITSTAFTTNTSFSSMSAENYTEVLSNCGNDASCAVDATVNRDGAGGAQSASTADGNGN